MYLVMQDIDSVVVYQKIDENIFIIFEINSRGILNEPESNDTYPIKTSWEDFNDIHYEFFYAKFTRVDEKWLKLRGWL